MNRLLFFLSLLMISTSLFAERFVVDGIRYETTSSNTVKVISNSYSGDIVIPENLERNYITYSVKLIDNQAFYYCSGLTSVTIPNSVTSIGDQAFTGCRGLTSVTIPKSVTSIGDKAFSGCIGLTSVTILCPTVGSWFSGMKTIKDVTLGEGVTSIVKEAFSGCSGLTSVTIGNSVTSIGGNAFRGCSGLTSVTILCPTVTNCFLGKESIKNVTLGEGVTSIGDNAFFGCSGLTSVTIPNNVTSIGKNAFHNCYGLTSVISLNTTPPQISENTFDGDTYTNATLKVPQGCKTIYWLHPYWEKFFNIEEIDVTKVESTQSEEKDIINSGYIYNLKGERINVDKSEFDNLPKGVYIMNGKKVLIR